jgi:hypothetical protein
MMGPFAQPIGERDERAMLRWIAWCEHQAVLPYLRIIVRLAQAAEADEDYREALRAQAVIHEQLATLATELRGLSMAHELAVTDAAWPCPALPKRS